MAARLRRRGGGGDELAHQVHEPVELFRIDPHRLVLGRTAFLDLLLAHQRRLHDRLLHAPLLHQQLAERLGRAVVLQLQGLVELAARQAAAVHEDIAQAQGGFLPVRAHGADQVDVAGDLAVRRKDVHHAVIEHELESAFDVGLAGAAAQRDLEAEIAGLRVQSASAGRSSGSVAMPVIVPSLLR